MKIIFGYIGDLVLCKIEAKKNVVKMQVVNEFTIKVINESNVS